MALDTETAVQLYMSMFGNMRVGLAIVRLETEEPELSPRLVDVNPAAGKICALLAGEPGSRRLDLYFPGLFGPDFSQILRRISGSGGSVDLGEKMVAERHYRVRVFALFDGFFGIVFTDFTERRKAQEEIAELLAKVQRNASDLEQRVAERTAQLEEINIELDSFAHSVSHDLRAPLRTMRGYAELLLGDPALGESERSDYLKRILSSAQGMERLIQDLLAYSHMSKQEIQLHTVSLAKVVRDASQQLELASGGKKYLLEVADQLPEVTGHHVVLVQVLLNLLTNALKFVRRGVTPRLRIWAEQGDGSLRLFVEDNGIGIAPQDQERIFKIFERLHDMESYPGTGIGLAIVRKAVARLGGEDRGGFQGRGGEQVLDRTAEAGRRTAGDGGRTTDDRRAEMSYVHHTVLVVDNNPDDAHFTALALQRVGVITPVQTVSDAEQAFNYLSGQGEFAALESRPMPVLVLLDLQLPGDKGLELLSWLRRQPVLKRLPVIVLTGSRDLAQMNRAYELGCNSYLVKPTSFNALVVMMQGLVQYWFSFNENPELEGRTSLLHHLEPLSEGA